MTPKPASSAPSIPRREFLTTMGAAVAGASLCSGCSLFLTYAQPNVPWSTGDGALVIHGAAAQKLSAPGGMIRAVSPDGDTRILLFRTPDGALRALSMACTHLGSDVNYNSEATELQCPSHGSRYDLEGHVVEGPADNALKQYAVEETATEIRVLL